MFVFKLLTCPKCSLIASIHKEHIKIVKIRSYDETLLYSISCTHL